jgi:hypothetical protein
LLRARFERRRPVVDVNILVALPGTAEFVRTRLSLSLDFGEERTAFANGDLDIPQLDLPPGERLVTNALLSFVDDAPRTITYRCEAVLKNGPPSGSRLGMDVLARWLVVIDYTEGLLLVEPRSSDF